MRAAKASVFLGDDDAAFIVAETPSEVAALVAEATDQHQPLVKLTLANTGDWNAKPLYVRVDRVTAISPPKDQDQADEDED